MSTAPAFSSAAEAAAAVRDGLRFLAAADATQMSVQSQAECLKVLEQSDAIATAARASILAGFTAAQGYADDGDYSARSWLIHQTRITAGAAVGHSAWAKRAVTHRLVMAALAAAKISESYARAICLWTGKLPEESREAADEILLAAAARGMELDDLAGLAGEMYERSRSSQPDPDQGKDFDDRRGPADDSLGSCDEAAGGSDSDAGQAAGSATSPARDALERAIIGTAVDLLSGPAGLAGFLRRRQLGARLGGPSLPLDIGYSATIPAGIRNAVILRDRQCRWPGGCYQPASACEVHHVRHKADGGKTSTKDCVLLCSFHHQVAIHRWGWTLVLNKDGTTTAWNKDKTKILHSHGPPARPG